MSKKAKTQKRRKAAEKTSRSYRLYECLKRHDGHATTDQLAEAAGVDSNFVNMYMGELKRVYGVKFQHVPRSQDYTITDLTVDIPKNGSRGRMRVSKQSATITAVDASNPRALAVHEAVESMRNSMLNQLNTFQRQMLAQVGNQPLHVAIPRDAWDQLQAHVPKGTLEKLGVASASAP